MGSTDGKSASDSLITSPSSKLADVLPALKYVLVNEGGYDDIPQDRGGATNMGITIGDFSEFLGRQATKDEVKAMTLDQAKEIYRKRYWDQMSCGLMTDQSIATAIFDMGVLCGIRTSPKWAQEILGLSVDGHIGPESLKALNSIDRADFIPKFANRAQSYFNSIVDNRPNQHRFLAGWTNRVNRLRALAKHDAVLIPHADQMTQSQAPTEYFGRLLLLASRAGCPSLGARLVNRMKEKFPGHSPQHVTLFDVSKNSDSKRLHILNTSDMTTLSITCGIGSGSDPNSTGMLHKFSNEPGSNCTSEGFFRYGETYISGKHGLACRMDGQDSTNSNMRSRAVVTHTASYVSDDHAGRTNGCQGIAETHHSEIPKLANGSFGYIGKEV